MSDADVSEVLGRGLAVEYTGSLRPMDEVELKRFMSGYQDLGGYAKGVKEALQIYVEAVDNLSMAQTQLKNALVGKKGSSSRVLFSNALPVLGDTALITSGLSKCLESMKETNDEVKNMVKSEILPAFDSLATMSALTVERASFKIMNEEQALFERALLSSLKTRKTYSSAMDRNLKVVQHRFECETRHFDLVRQLNKADADKKLKLTKALCKFFHVLDYKNQRDARALMQDNDKIDIQEKLNVGIPQAEREREHQEQLWDRVRGRLCGELMGEKPPPGAPSNALSPDYAKAIRHAGIYLWSLSLKTEVLTENTRAASEASLRHVRDGVYKQGYLTVLTPTSILFGRRVRSWYRLYGSKLYMARADMESCDFDFVLSIRGAVIRAVTEADSPHIFRVTTAAAEGGSVHDFQADNDDECYQWLTTLCRWSGESDDGQGERERGHSFPTHAASQQRDNPKWKAFLDKNNTCADCGHPNVKWLSLNLGVTICDDCYRGHQSLTWAISKLKSITMDTFTDWHVDLLHDHLGNDKVNAVYAISVPAGWQKPQSDTAMELKVNWIVAKYLWHSFVEDPPSDKSSEDQMTRGLREAVTAGLFEEMLWYYAHGAIINTDSASDSVLVAALMTNRADLVSFLLLNGADWTAATSAISKHKGETSAILLKIVDDCAAMLY